MGSKLVHVVNMWDFVLREGGEGWASKIRDQPLFFQGKNVEVSIFWLKWFSNFGLLIFNRISFPIKLENSLQNLLRRKNQQLRRTNISSQQKLDIFPATLGTRILGRNSIASIEKRWNMASQEIWRLIPNHDTSWVSCHEPCWVKSVTARQKALVCELLGQITKNDSNKN